MQAWTCPHCGQSNGTAFDICWNCGTGMGGDPPAPDFVRDDVPIAHPQERELDCLRCRQPMTSQGLMRFHEGSQAAPFLLGGLGELLVRRQGFQVFACGGCGKVEFFLPTR